MSVTGNPVVHFEIGCIHLAQTTEFYNSVFGWTSINTEVASFLKTQSAEGIQGHLTSLGHEPYKYVTVYIQVPDIDEYLLKIESGGGKRFVGPITLPDKRKFAWFYDPEGNMIGLLSNGEK